MAATVQRSGEVLQDTAVVFVDVVDVRHDAREDNDVVVVRADTVACKSFCKCHPPVPEHTPMLCQ